MSAVLDHINMRLGRLRAHPLIRLIEEHLEAVGSPTGSSMRIDYRDGAGNLSYPTVSINWRDTPADTRAQSLRAHRIAHLRDVFLAALRKIAFGIEALSQLKVVDDHQCLLALEYHAENYFMRLSSLVEQLHRLVGAVLDTPGSDTSSVRSLATRIERVAPDLAPLLAELRKETKVTKVRRNEVAHMAEYDDERLSVLRNFGSHAMESGWRFVVNPHHVDLLSRYQTHFVAAADAELTKVSHHLAAVLDGLLPLAEARLLTSRRGTRNVGERPPDHI